jgi:hypothetical protein
MEKIKSKSGAVAITVVVVITLSLTLAVLLLYILVNAKLDSILGYKDRVIAYYLCETGISVAMLDFGRGNIGKGKNQWTERSFDFDIGKKKYAIHYKITRPSGSTNYKVTSSVKSPLGFKRSYYLTAAGPRAFPIFIRGFAGGK